MLFISPELKTEQTAYHQKMIDTPQIQYYWPYILKYPLFDNAFMFILFIFPFFAVFSYKYLLFLLLVPAVILFSYLMALLEHTSNGYALPPRGDRLLGGFFVKLILLIGGRSNKTNTYTSLSTSLTTIMSYINSRLFGDFNDKVDRLGQRASPVAIKQALFIVFSIGLLTWCNYYLPTIATTLIIILWLTLLPASLVQIAIDSRVSSGINIKRIHILIRKIGSEYAWVIVITLINAGLFYSAIMQFSGILFIICLLLCLYTFIACFHLLGYLIYHRRHHIGFLAKNTPEGNKDAELDKLYAQADSIVQQAKVHITDRGLFKHGFEILILRLSTAKDDLALHKQVSILLFEWQDKRLALKHAELYLHLLIQQQKYVTAYQLMRKALAQQADFTPMDADDYLTFIEYLLRVQQDYSLTLYLIHSFEQHYLNHKYSFAIQLLKARLFSNNGRNVEQPNDILRSLLTQTKHPLHKDALKLASDLKKQAI